MSDRMRRVNEAVREVISEAVGELKDPRVGFVTVTGVETSLDLRHATVFVSVLGTERKREKTLAGLTAAHGVLQARVARHPRWATASWSRSTAPTRAGSGRLRPCSSRRR